MKGSETLNTDFKKLQERFDVVKDKLSLVQADLFQFVRPSLFIYISY